MNEYIEQAKNLAPFIPLVKPLIDTLVKPKLDLLSGWLRKQETQNKVDNYNIYQDAFQDYLCRVYQKCSIINTLIFPNQQLDLERIYQPLTLIDNQLGKQEKIKVESFPTTLFEKYQKVLVCDSAGMGKSTLSRFISLQTIKQEVGIPVFIELRKLNSKNSIINEFKKQLNSINEVFSNDFILQLLKQGEFLIIFDGFDEITNEDKEFVTNDIKKFILDCNENYFLLTSRPESALSSFGEFKVTNIKGLRPAEAYELLQKFDCVSKASLSESLINEVKGINNQVNEFLVNPFLVSLLYKTYSFKRDIPSRKSTFYNEVYTALYQDHDLSKDSYKRDKHSKLDIQDFRLVLRELANYTAKKGEVEYEKGKAIQYISDCKVNLKFLSFKEASFVDDLLTTVPVFTTEGINIKWSHKSLQDYFAAEYITSHPQKSAIINHLIEKDIQKYQNIIELIIELDPNLIRQYVLPSILKDLIQHYESSYQYLDSKISDDELAIRRMITFDSKCWANKVPINKSKDKGIVDDFGRVTSILQEQGESINTDTQYSSRIIMLYQISNRAVFLQLLGSKGILGKSIYKGKVTENLNKRMFTIQPELIIDDENMNYNQPNFFSKTTRMMSQSSRMRLNQNRLTFVADIKFIRELYHSIINETQSIKSEEYLNGYLKSATV